MKGAINPDTISNTIRMLRSQFSGVFVLVEGTLDSKVYRNILSKDVVYLIFSNGKNNIIEVLSRDEISKLSRVIGIVDRDFWGITSPSVDLPPNVFITDLHDLECMLIESPALEKVIDILGSPSKIDRLGCSVRDLLLEQATIIGALRYCSDLHDLRLRFKPKSETSKHLKWLSFTDRKHLSIDLCSLITTVKNYTGLHQLNENITEELVTEILACDYDVWHLCNGHDLICLLSIALKSKIGSCKEEDVKVSTLENYLALGYELSFFQKTELYAELFQWQESLGYEIIST